MTSTTVRMTTIKVPVEVRDRLRERAAASHKSQSEALTELLDDAEHENIQRLIQRSFDRWGPALDKLA